MARRAKGNCEPSGCYPIASRFGCEPNRALSWESDSGKLRVMKLHSLTSLCLVALFLPLLGCQTTPAPKPRAQWTPEQANAWYAKQPWLVGGNYTPRTAINQLEMWQADTWDPTDH